MKQNKHMLSMSSLSTTRSARCRCGVVTIYSPKHVLTTIPNASIVLKKTQMSTADTAGRFIFYVKAVFTLQMLVRMVTLSWITFDQVIHSYYPHEIF